MDKIFRKEGLENLNIDQHNVLIEQWRNEDDSFVCTRAADEVLKRIRNDISVIVSGNSGVGKTATMRHVALLLKKEGYRIIPVCTPEDLKCFSQKGVKTLFVIDDICGHFTLKDHQVDKWEEILTYMQPFLEQNPCKIIATCRLQVFKDAKFKALSLFNSSECNLNSEAIKLTTEEKSRLAEMYFKEHANEVKGLSDQFDFFPLLCKLYQKSNCKDINHYFHNPFEFYRQEIERLPNEGKRGKLKYCCLVLCVLFNNRIAEKHLQSQNSPTQDLIEKTLIQCKLNKGTSFECLKESFQTLENTLITKVDGTYRTIHDKLFDFLAQIVVGNNVDLCIKNCSSDFIRERFIWNPVNTSQNNTNLSIKLLDTHVDIYIERLIKDWSDGLTASVFCNINMKSHEFIDKLMKSINNLDASEKKKLAQKTDNESKDSPLLLSSFIGNISLTKWLLENTGFPAKTKNFREVVSRVNRNNYVHPHINMRRQNGTTSLYVACENGHLQLLKMLLTYGADATLKKKSDDSPLSVACDNGHTNIVNEILENTDVDKDYQNKNGFSPLYFACQNGHDKIVQILLKYNVNINLCSKLGVLPLFVACEKGYLSIVKNLLSYGADVNGQNNTGQVPLHAACYKNHVEVVRMLLDNVSISVNILDNKHISPLYATCQCSKGHFEVMKLLLQRTADVNNGRPPLIMTCANGNIKMSKKLIEHKADVNSCRSDGVSPLFMACQHRHYETVCLLFKFNADPNVHRENCASPLMIASQNGDVEIVEKLLKHGCNINRCTSDGVSSLYLAAQNGHSNVVSQLIEAGASLDMSDTDGKTALFKACQNGHLEIVSKLLTYKANAHLRMVNNVSPMEIAEKNKHLEIVKVLKKHEVDERKLSWETFW
ncbi:CDK inhibitor PHO81 [Mytilus galloprovincialis]|uniref:CDK inhibitor PHO81 n=1 Tax=Mytilus galloprovincialis TaxID=29158 RepID=A0A8B6BE51_MYTGA|nr:CDK inhibitor PHO81 [Mytilus galloprovincialis]